MSHKKPTKAEEAWLTKVALMGCIVCEMQGYPETPSEIHHIRTGAGGAQRSSHYKVIPLCPIHHRTGGYGLAIHAGQKRWEKLYGTELELLAVIEDRMSSSTVFILPP